MKTHSKPTEHNITVLKYAHYDDPVGYYKYTAECSCGGHKWYTVSYIDILKACADHLIGTCVGFATIETD